MSDEHRAARAYGLRAEGLRDPIGIPTSQPALSWRVEGTADFDAFVVQAATDNLLLCAGHADIFDIDLSPVGAHHLKWPARALGDRERAYWRVGVRTGTRMSWSEPASIEAPLWETADWEADAITHPRWLEEHASELPMPEVMYRFTVPAAPVCARLYLTGAGVVVPTLNGEVAIRGNLEPGYSTLEKGVPASAWDVTASIMEGENAIGVRLGSGIASVPQLLGRYTKFARETSAPWVRIRMEILDESGTTTVVTTGRSWRARLGATLVAHWYGGEDYGGAAPGCWSPAAVVPDAVASWWRATPPVVVTETLVPVAATREGERRTLDLGTNVAGRPTIRTTELPVDATVRIAPAELVDDRHRIDQSTTGSPIWDTWMAIDESESPRWSPSFVYHGGRYLEVTGLPADAPDDTIGFEVMRTDNEKVGEFSSSDPFLDRLHAVIDRAVQSNMYSVFTDCPHREKLGWIEQLYIVFDTLARGYDVQAQLGDAVKHMIDAQTDTGLVPSTVPELVIFAEHGARGDATSFRDDPNWGRAIVEVPWRLYRHYGDDSAIRKALPSMQRYLEHLEERADGDILDIGLGDWIEIDESTPRDFVATHGWAQTLRTAAFCADAIGQIDHAMLWHDRADAIWAALTRRFRDDAGLWGSGSQGSWALATTVEGLDESEHARIVAELIARVHSDGDSITVGEISLSPLIRALTDHGHADLLHRMIQRTDTPGYGRQLASGATALTESWRKPDDSEGVASQNHFMLGAIDDWIVGDVAGLRQAPDSVGWRSVIIRPTVLTGVQDARTVFESPAGRFDVGWRRMSDDRIIVTVVAPPGIFVQLPQDEGVEARLSRA